MKAAALPGILEFHLFIDWREKRGGGVVDPIEWSASVYTAAAAIARCAESQEELTRLALLFTQLGTTLSTIAALQALNQNTAAGDAAAADLSSL